MKKFTLLIPSGLKLFLLVSGLLFGQVLFAKANDIPQGDITVKGKVTDKDGPLAGVTVRVDNSSTITTTDANGSYTITAPDNSTLVFSYSGYKEQRIAIKGQTTINVAMVPGANQMDG